MPYFVPHADFWNSIYPWVDSEIEEMSQFEVINVLYVFSVAIIMF